MQVCMTCVQYIVLGTLFPFLDLIKPSNSLPTDILASNEADSFVTNSTTSLIATNETNNSKVGTNDVVLY